MKEPLSPCFMCKSRSEDCHASCKSYLIFKCAHDEWNASVRKSKSSDDEIIAFHLASKHSNLKQR